MVWKRWILIISLLILSFLAVGVFSLNEKPFVFPQSLPSDWIDETQIHVESQKIVLNIQNATWARFTDTHSMEPSFGAAANAIEVKPRYPEEINVGDIISYTSPYGVIIHRVIEKNTDTEGIYFLAKGDNNPLRDPYKIRFSQIRGVVVAIVY